MGGVWGIFLVLFLLVFLVGLVWGFFSPGNLTIKSNTVGLQGTLIRGILFQIVCTSRSVDCGL